MPYIDPYERFDVGVYPLILTILHTKGVLMKKLILFVLIIAMTIPTVHSSAVGGKIIVDVNVNKCVLDTDGGVELNWNYDNLGIYRSAYVVNNSDYIVASFEENVSYDPHISYEFNLEQDCSIYVWGRVKIKSGDISDQKSADSVFWSVDSSLGSDYSYSSLSLIDKDYKWFQFGGKSLSKGKHKLNIRVREKNFEISHIKITDSSTYLVWDGSPYNPPKVTPEGLSHPRVLINSNTIDTVKANLNNPENSYFYELYQSDLKTTISTTTTNIVGKDIRAIQCMAFKSLTENDADTGKKAISYLKNRMDKIVFTSAEDYNPAGRLVYCAALVYDWCYDYLTDEDINYIIEKSLEILSKYTEMGWPPIRQSGYSGHGSENTLLRDYLALGIAVYDEYPDIYDITAGRIYDEYKEARQVYFKGHKSLFGTGYGVYRGKHDLTAYLLFKAIGEDDIWETDDFGKVPYWYVYAKRPDRYYLDDGDGRENASSGLLNPKPATYMQLGAASAYNDGYLKYDAMDEINFRKDTYGNDVIYEEYLETLIFNDVNLESKSVEELNYSKYFPYPSGVYVARTGWDEDSVVVSMKVNELTIADHNHLDAGGFQIYYKGNLAVDSGYYQGINNSYRDGYYGNYFGDVYHQAYYRQTIAHNCMLIYDENEPDLNFVKKPDEFSFKVNTGGQKSVLSLDFNPESAEQLETNELYNKSKVLAHEHNEDVRDPDFTYLKGDLTKAYSSDKLDSYERSFMFLNLKNKDVPAALIVLDHVISTDSGYKKTYLLHGVNAPVIDKVNNRVTLIRDEKNVAPTEKYPEGYDYNGKLVNDVLLPKSVNITKIGENKEDYYVNDVNLKTLASSNENYGIEEGGGIRCEISPANAAKEDYFLNVMQVSDADSVKEPLSVKLNETSNTHIGVEISDRVVMLGKNKEKYNTEISFAISQKGNYNISVTDLESGKWYIYKDGEYAGFCDVSSEGSVAYFKGGKGNYLLTTTPGETLSMSTINSFYPGLFEFNGKNAFLSFGRIIGMSNLKNVNDYGIIVKEGICTPVLDEENVHKISIKDKNHKVNSNDVLEFGTLVYGNKIKNFTPYSIRTYLITEENGVKTVRYGVVSTDYVRNFGEYKRYPVTGHELN